MIEQTKTQEEIAIESKLSAFFGAFEDIDSEEMIKSIEESRTTKDINISWVK